MLQLPPRGPSWTDRSRTGARGDPKPESRPGHKNRATRCPPDNGGRAADAGTTTPRRPCVSRSRAWPMTTSSVEPWTNESLAASGYWTPPPAGHLANGVDLERAGSTPIPGRDSRESVRWIPRVPTLADGPLGGRLVTCRVRSRRPQSPTVSPSLPQSPRGAGWLV